MKVGFDEPCHDHLRFACDVCDSHSEARRGLDRRAIDDVIEAMCPNAGFYQRIKIKVALDAWMKLNAETIKEDHVESYHRDHTDD